VKYTAISLALLWPFLGFFYFKNKNIKAKATDCFIGLELWGYHAFTSITYHSIYGIKWKLKHIMNCLTKRLKV